MKTFIGRKVISPFFGLQSIVDVEEKKGSINSFYIILENGSRFCYPDSFEEKYLSFEDIKYQEPISIRIKEHELELAYIEKKKQEQKKIRKLKTKLSDFNFSNNIAYLGYYYSTRKEDIERDINSIDKNSLGILAFKAYNDDYWIYDSIIGGKQKRREYYEYFTRGLFYLVGKVIFTKLKNPNKVYLIPIPSSQKGKFNTISKSAKQIVKWAHEGHLYNEYCISTKLIDGTNFLERIINIDAEKMGMRCIKSHLQSIQVNQKFSEDDYIILLDDITTTGTIIAACRELLTNNGALQSNIYSVVIGKTKQRFCDDYMNVDF